MSSIVEKQSTINFHAFTASQLSKIQTTLPTNAYVLESANESIESKSCEIYGNVQSDAPIIVLLSRQDSQLYRTFIQYLLNQDVVLIIFSSEQYLSRWLTQNSSLNITNLVLESLYCTQQFILDCHSIKNVHSILICCNQNELCFLEQYTRRLPKVDAEQSGDESRYENRSELEVQRNYDRAVRFCELIENI